MRQVCECPSRGLELLARLEVARNQALPKYLASERLFACRCASEPKCDTIDAPTLIRFLRRLCRDAGRKVIVIPDNLSVHKARDVRAWVADHADQIELCYLPSSAPELNPDEYLNGDLKLSVAKRAPARDRAALLRTATARLRSLQQQPERVKKFF